MYRRYYFLRSVNELRLRGVLCDAILQVDNIPFRIHKIILCKCSPYFLALFTRWTTPDQNVFVLPGISPKMMQFIIEFAYTGCILLTQNIASELIIVADQFSVMDLVCLCSNFLQKNLSPENCISIFQLSNVFHCTELKNKAFHYIIDNFHNVIFCEELMELSEQELANILKRDELNVREESNLFEAILRWIHHKPEQRRQYIGLLLSKVRLALMNKTYVINNVMKNELVKKSTECQVLVTQTLEIFDYFMTNRNTVTALSNTLACPRLPNAILLAIGGWSDNDPTNVIEVYDFRANSWMTISENLERARAYHGAIFLNGSVYCIGGFNRVEYFNIVYRLNMATCTWHEVSSMIYRRCYVSVALLNGCIYAMGGFDGHTRLMTAERYKPETNQWSLIASMNEQRSDASCTTLHNKIYICGGFNGHECLDTAECYNPETNQWTMISNMNYRRSGIGVIAYAGHVYAVGGFNGTIRLQSAEYYNHENNTWHEVANMQTPRSNFGIEVLDNKLFAVGGFNGFTTTFKVEFYNIWTDQWTEVANMAMIRSALSCCIAFGLTNLKQYVTPRSSLPKLNEEEEEEEEVED